MSEGQDKTDVPPQPSPRPTLAVGYRAGLISAITVVLGFSLLFLRYWTFEAPGTWSVGSISATLLLVAAIATQLVALWRALQPEDEDLGEYRRTLRWFFGAIFALFASLLLAALIASHAINI